MQYLYHNRHIRGVKHAVSLSQQRHQRGQAYHNRDIRGVKHAVSEGLSMQCPYHNREYRNPMQWPKKRSGASTQAKRGRNFRPKKQITIRGVKTTNKKQKAYITKIHAFILYEVHKIPFPNTAMRVMVNCQFTILPPQDWKCALNFECADSRSINRDRRQRGTLWLFLVNKRVWKMNFILNCLGSHIITIAVTAHLHHAVTLNLLPTEARRT